MPEFEVIYEQRVRLLGTVRAATWSEAVEKAERGEIDHVLQDLGEGGPSRVIQIRREYESKQDSD